MAIAHVAASGCSVGPVVMSSTGNLPPGLKVTHSRGSARTRVTWPDLTAGNGSTSLAPLSISESGKVTLKFSDVVSVSWLTGHQTKSWLLSSFFQVITGVTKSSESVTGFWGSVNRTGSTQDESHIQNSPIPVRYTRHHITSKKRKSSFATIAATQSTGTKPKSKQSIISRSQYLHLTYSQPTEVFPNNFSQQTWLM